MQLQHSRSRRRRGLVVVAAVVLLVTGCSGDDEPTAEDTASGSASPTASAAATTDPSAPSDAPTSGVAPQPSGSATLISSDAELKATVVAYSDAFLQGRASDAYELLSSECKASIALPEFTEIVTAAQALYGAALPITSFQGFVSGDTAVVTYTYEVAALNQAEEQWAFEDGAWRLNRCE